MEMNERQAYLEEVFRKVQAVLAEFVELKKQSAETDKRVAETLRRADRLIARLRG
jgi:hypothetical protein